MLMTDGQIRTAMSEGRLTIEPFADECLQPASYDMRVGRTALRSGDDVEINVRAARGITLYAGQFALLVTYESLKLSPETAGHIGVRSYFTRKGLILLSGLQIDPGFEGVLVLGVYNASPRRLTLDYQAAFCTVEFHHLSAAAEEPYHPNEEQRRGAIPNVDKDYLRMIETESLSEVAESVRTLSQNVGVLNSTVKITAALTIGTLLAVVAFGLAVLLT
jgi:dCTP deaminase